MPSIGVPELLIILLVTAFFVSIIAYAINQPHKNEKFNETELLYNQIMQKLPSDKQAIFLMQYNNVKKNPTTAFVLCLFLGGLGAHKFYLEKIGLGVLYVLFSWTTIPAWIALVELFFLPKIINKYNQQKMLEISSLLIERPSATV